MIVLKNMYDLYKLKYENYILLFKSGNFYVSLNNDALVLNKIMGYKIIQNKELLKIGFPISSLNKVLKVLEDKNVNYLIIDREIIDNVKYKKNNYENYLDKQYIDINNKIDNIYNLLKNNINKSNIKDTIKEIENILWKINC